jgi:hypothetical protein
MAIKSIEERLQRLEHIREIENLMARYAYLHTAGMHEEAWELFAKETPGVRMEISPLGMWEGAEGVKRAMVKFHKWMGVGNPGHLFVHTQTTSVIEVAGDGKTAKGVWMSPGIETRKTAETGQFVGFWVWGHYGVDFVQENGKWKFWHLHVYAFMITPYDKSWTEQRQASAQPLPDEIKPDRRGIQYSVYSPTAEIHYIPVPPEPYETFDEARAY